MKSGEELADRTFWSFTRFKSIKPALLLLKIKSTNLTIVACLDDTPSKRHPIIMFAASGPTTLILSGLPLGNSGLKVKAGTGLDCI